MRKHFCLVIPTYNERENIAKVISRIDNIRSKLAFELSLIVVDDGSTDGTVEYVKNAIDNSEGWIELLERPNLLGIGAAYLDGFTLGRAQLETHYYGEMDADLQHPPETLFDMCEKANSGVDVVIASRYVDGGGSTSWSLSRRIVSRTANILAKLSIRSPVSDSTSGFRILSSRAVLNLLQSKVSSKGYSFQIESLYVYKKAGMTFAEVPYTFEERKSGVTKLNWKEMARFAIVALRVGIFGTRKAN